MKVKAENVGSCDYLTAGKEYELLNPVPGKSGGYVGSIIDDDGDLILVCTEMSIHIQGKAWQVVDQQ